MNRAVTGLCVASAFGLVVTLGAQTPGQTTGTSGTDQRTSSTRTDSTKDVTVSGCLSKDATGNYTLNNARIEPSGSGSTAGTAGTTGTSAGTTSGTTGGTTGGTSSSSPYGSSASGSETWRLSGKSSDLDKHIGHKIQVTGKEMSSSSSTTTSTGSTTGSTTGTTGTSTESSASHRLDVDSVKMVAASCS